ncbi:MAG: hypothetical protein QNJ90_15815 [Planctomycetota bacterium]|nr:hypothetical protein [Planctomycetota bacterium]
MRVAIFTFIRLSVGVTAGWFAASVFGDRYDRYAAEPWQLDASVFQAARITGAMLGLLLASASMTAWLRTASHGFGFLRGAVAGGLAALIAQRTAGAFTDKLGFAVLAFALLGGLLATIGRRPRERAPAMGRIAKRTALGTVGGIVLGLGLAAAARPEGLGILLYAYLPAAFAAVGFAIGVLMPEQQEA